MASIEWLKAQISRKKKKLREYEKRRKEVEKILISIGRRLPGKIEDANKDIKSCAAHLEDAVVLNRFDIAAVDQVRRKKEGSINSDSRIAQIGRNMASEEKRCASEIRTLKAEIARLEAELSEAKKEAVSDFFGGIFG